MPRAFGARHDPLGHASRQISKSAHCITVPAFVLKEKTLKHLLCFFFQHKSPDFRLGFLISLRSRADSNPLFQTLYQ